MAGQHVESQAKVPADTLKTLQSYLLRQSDNPAEYRRQLLKTGLSTQERLVVQGLYNHYQIPSIPKDLWPSWAVQQSNPESEFFSSGSPSAVLLNESIRSGTVLSKTGASLSTMVDPQGVVYPTHPRFAIDHLFITENARAYASFLDGASQRLDPETGGVYTDYEWEGVQWSIYSAFSQQSADSAQTQQIIRLKNREDAPKKVSVVVVIKPYHIEGLNPISSIQYLSSNLVLVDQCPGLVFKETPRNIVCFSLADGSFIEQSDQLEMILQSHCSEYLASGYFQYTYTLGPNEQSLSYSIPHSQQAQRLDTKYKVSRYLESRLPAYQHKSIDSILTPLKGYSQKVQQSLSRIDFPQAKIKQLLRSSQAYVLNSLGMSPDRYRLPFLYPDSSLAYYAPILQVLNRFNHVNTCRKRLEQLIQSQGSGNWRLPGLGRSVMEIAQLMALMADFFQFSQSQVTIERHFPLIQKYYNTLEKSALMREIQGLPSRSLFTKQLQHTDLSYDHAHIQSLLYLQSALKSMQLMGKAIEKEIPELTVSLKKVQRYLARILKSISEKPKVLSHPTEYISELPALLSVYPLNDPVLSTEQQARVLEELKGEEVHGLHFYNAQYKGLSPLQNILYVQSLVASGAVSEAYHVFQWLLDRVSATGTWPELINPRTGQGSIGSGHCLSANAEFLLLIYNSIVSAQGTELRLLPFYSHWIQDNESEYLPLDCKTLLTKFGAIDLNIQRQGEHHYHCTFRHRFHASPTAVTLQWHAPVHTIRFQGKPEQTHDGQEIRIPLAAGTFEFWTKDA